MSAPRPWWRQTVPVHRGSLLFLLCLILISASSWAWFVAYCAAGVVGWQWSRITRWVTRR